MTSKGTPHRPIRINDATWAKAQEKAKRLGTTASAKARELLEAWAEEPDSACTCWHEDIIMGDRVIRTRRTIDPSCEIHQGA